MHYKQSPVKVARMIKDFYLALEGSDRGMAGAA